MTLMNRKGKSMIGIIVPLAIMLFASIFLILGIVFIRSDKKASERCTEKTVATIIENKTVISHSNGSHMSSRTYAPVFQYEFGGKTYTVESNVSQSPAKFSVGETTEIFVDPKSPKKIFVPEMRTLRLLGIIFTIVGSVAAAAAVFVFIILKKV